MTSASTNAPGPSWQKGIKPKKIGPTLKRLLDYFGKYRKYLYLMILADLVMCILIVMGPQYLGKLTDSVSASIVSGTPLDMDGLAGIALTIALIYGVAVAIEIVVTRYSWIMEEIIGDHLRIDLSKKVAKIPVSEMDRVRSGDIMSRFVNDTDTLRVRSTDCFIHLFESVSMLLGCTAIMLITDWRLALSLLIPTLVGFLIIRVIVKRSQKYYRMQSKNLGKINTVIEETYRGLNVVSVYNGMEGTRKKFNEINDELYDVAFRTRILAGLMPEITAVINNIGYVLVCVVGSILILDGSATFGTLVAFIVYAKLTNQPLMRISNAFSTMQEVAAASERVFEFLDMPEMDDESDKGKAPEIIRGDVEFKDVCFSYVPGTEVIHELNLNVKSGQKIAIVGPTGAGKTTMANLLLRYYDPNSGSISIDGIPLTDIRKNEVRKMFGVVLQETWLFKGTIRENLVFGRTDIPDDRIERICRSIGLGDFLEAQTDGLDTYIDNPSALSAGQRQQITIARAVIKDAPLLIMDEATSSVDTRTEREIQNAMDELMKGRTCFVIAHRLSTIKNADRILVIRKGRIVESGTHDELISEHGFYRSLYDSQFEFCD